MKTIIILVNAYFKELGVTDAKTGRRRYVSLPLMERITLATEVSLSNSPDIPGLWTGHSQYLGRTLTGNYFIRNEHSGSLGATLGHPAGYFHDDDKEIPFMILRNFLPQKLVDRSHGMLLRVNMPVVDMNLRWFSGSGI